MFLLFIKFEFLRKNGVFEKIKSHLPEHLPALQQLTSPHLFNFIQKIVSPTPHLKKRAETALHMRDRLHRRDNKVITILYKRFFIYRTVKS